MKVAKYKNPKIVFTSLPLSDNKYCDGHGNTYSTATLVQYCKEQNYPVFKMPLACVNLDCMPFDVKNLDSFIWQMKRVKDTDLKYPILLDNFGRICDGYHRVCKALLEGKTEIDAIRILDMPRPDAYTTVKE